MDHHLSEHHLTLAEAANRIQRDASVLRRMIIKGFLPAVKAGKQWYVAEDVVEGLAAYDRLPGRPSKASLRVREKVRVQLVEIAMANLPSSKVQLIGRQGTHGEDGREPRGASQERLRVRR